MGQGAGFDNGTLSPTVAAWTSADQPAARNGGRGADLATFHLHWVFGFEAIWTEIVAVGWRSVMADEMNHNSLPISKRVLLLLSARSFDSP